MRRLYIRLDIEKIVFVKQTYDPVTWNSSVIWNEYKATPRRIMSVLNASSKYTHYEG